MVRAIKVGEGTNENSFTMPSTSLKICYYPLPTPISLRFQGNLEHYLGKKGGGKCPHTSMATPLFTRNVEVDG